jgi:LysM repeat protein
MDMKKSSIAVLTVLVVLVGGGCAMWSDNSRPSLLGGDVDFALLQNRSSKSVSKVQDSQDIKNDGSSIAEPVGGGTITLTPEQLRSLVEGVMIKQAEMTSARGMHHYVAEPVGPEYNDPPNVYRVKRGDNLWTIAGRYDTTVEDLKKLNGMPGTQVEVGQVLTVPVKKK